MGSTCNESQSLPVTTAGAITAGANFEDFNVLGDGMLCDEWCDALRGDMCVNILSIA